jgi:hypothetical protein
LYVLRGCINKIVRGRGKVAFDGLAAHGRREANRHPHLPTTKFILAINLKTARTPVSRYPPRCSLGPTRVRAEKQKAKKKSGDFTDAEDEDEDDEP